MDFRMNERGEDDIYIGVESRYCEFLAFNKSTHV